MNYEKKDAEIMNQNISTKINLAENLLKDDIRISGHLILGDVAEGKTTILAYETENLLRLHTEWNLVAVGNKEYFDKLSPSIKTEPRSRFFEMPGSFKPIGIELQEEFLNTIYEIINITKKYTLIAIDEPAIFFADEKLRERFVQLLIEENRSGTIPVRLIITGQNLELMVKLFGADFTFNFGGYILLRTRISQKFFDEFGVDTSDIEKGNGIILMRQEKRNNTNLCLKILEKFEFVPGVPEIKPILPEGRKMIHFLFFILPLLILAGVFLYLAPAMDWMSVGSNNLPNPFARRESGLVFNAKTIWALFWYFAALVSFSLFVFRSVRFFSRGYAEGRLDALVLVSYLIALLLIPSLVDAQRCDPGMCSPEMLIIVKIL